MPNANGGLCAAFWIGSAHALTATDCRNAFGNACPSYGTSGTTSCTCEGCTTPMSQVVQTANGLYLGQSCGGSSGTTTTNYKLCDLNTNPCSTGVRFYDNTGQLYCRVSPIIANCATDPNAVASFVTSPFCEDGNGVIPSGQGLTPQCMIVHCNEPYAPQFNNPTACNTCAPRYYDNRTNYTDPLSCAKCPELDGVTGDSALGSSAITQCYITSLETMSDTTGQYKFDTTCYYKN